MIVNTALFGIGLKQKLFQSQRNICFQAIQNGSKLNKVFQSWKMVHHQIFCGKKRNLRRMTDVYKEACYSQVNVCLIIVLN